MQRAVNSSYVGSIPTLSAMRYEIEAGTMLYDLHFKMIGWVVGKRTWNLPGGISVPHILDDDDWDVEWSNGKKNYYGGGSLQIFVNDYIALKKSIIK